MFDETAPEGPHGIFYVVAAVVALDPDSLRAGLVSILPAARRRPFHWAREGPEAIEGMLELIESNAVGARATVHHA